MTDGSGAKQRGRRQPLSDKQLACDASAGQTSTQFACGEIFKIYGPVGIIIRLCSHISEQILPRPPRPRHAPRMPEPRRPRGIGSCSRGTLYDSYQNFVRVGIASSQCLEVISALTKFWYNNNICPRKKPGRTFNLSIENGECQKKVVLHGVPRYVFASLHEISKFIQ